MVALLIRRFTQRFFSLVAHKPRLGFTLIELLVTLSIISILAGLGLANYSTSQKRARDARRKADLSEIRAALEMYRADIGFYPLSGCGYDCPAPPGISGWRFSSAGDSWIPELVSGGYLQKVPVDPKNTGSAPWNTDEYVYAYGNVGRTTYGASYDLTAQLENTSDPDRCGVRNWRFHFTDLAWCVAFGGSYSNQIYEASPN